MTVSSGEKGESFPEPVETIACTKTASVLGKNSSEVFLFYIPSFTLAEYFLIWDVTLTPPSLTEFKRKLEKSCNIQVCYL